MPTPSTIPHAVFWFRRDLRLEDNTGLYQALQSGLPVIPLFIFDDEILHNLEDTHDARVHFIHHALLLLQEQLLTHGSTLVVQQGTPENVWHTLLQQYTISQVYTNHDYEPYAKKRDAVITKLLKKQNIAFYTSKDQVIFEKDEVLKNDGTPYTVFTPYSKKWRYVLQEQKIQANPSQDYQKNFWKHAPLSLPSLSDIGFQESEITFPKRVIPTNRIQQYTQQRDFPAKSGTTRLSVHLRFGTISIRTLVNLALDLNETWLNELIWREFYMMILWHFPHVVHTSFQPQYDNIQWRNNTKEFALWCSGKTGYPLVDAGMRELNTTGFMHNRTRMVTASFLTKHLGIDWRWGEAYFSQKLLDFELSSNNGGWQWAAGTGCDASPYFRVFNPYLQEKKFDPEQHYIRKWIPEINSDQYPSPIVEHKMARKRAITMYANALGTKDISQKR